MAQGLVLWTGSQVWGLLSLQSETTGEQGTDITTGPVNRRLQSIWFSHGLCTRQHAPWHRGEGYSERDPGFELWALLPVD